MWNVINHISKKVNNKSELCSILVNGESITDQSKISRELNEHFVSVGTKVQNTMQNVQASVSTVTNTTRGRILPQMYFPNSNVTINYHVHQN